MNMPDLKTLSDGELSRWNDTISSLNGILHLGDLTIFDAWRNESLVKIGELYSTITDELMARQDRKEAESLRNAENEPAPEPTSMEYDRWSLRNVMVRIIRLMDLNAPNVIISHEIALLIKRADKFADHTIANLLDAADAKA